MHTRVRIRRKQKSLVLTGVKSVLTGLKKRSRNEKVPNAPQIVLECCVVSMLVVKRS